MTISSKYRAEKPAKRAERVDLQERNRAQLVDDHMELIYTLDLDELFAEMRRLHEIVGDDRTLELLRRVLPERCAADGI